MDRLAIPANHAPDISLTQLHLENGRPSARNFGQHHVVGKFDQLSDYELKKLAHTKDPNHEFT
jgi:hypothetical protein